MRSLFDDPEPELTPAHAPRTHDAQIAGLIDQIARDMATLAVNEGPNGVVVEIFPSEEFYRQRINDYRAEVLRLRGLS